MTDQDLPGNAPDSDRMVEAEVRPRPISAFLTVSSAATSAGVTARQVRRWISEGKVSAQKRDGKSYRIDRAELQRFLEAREAEDTIGQSDRSRPSAEVRMTELERQLTDVKRDKADLADLLRTAQANLGREQENVREFLRALPEAKAESNDLRQTVAETRARTETLETENQKLRRQFSAQRKAAEDLQSALERESGKSWWQKLRGR